MTEMYNIKYIINAIRSITNGFQETANADRAWARVALADLINLANFMRKRVELEYTMFINLATDGQADLVRNVLLSSL